MTEAARVDTALAAQCLLAFRDRVDTDEGFVGAVLISDAIHDLALIRSAYQKK